MTYAGFDGECLDKFSGRYSTITQTRTKLTAFGESTDPEVDTLEKCIECCGEKEAVNKKFQVGLTYSLKIIGTRESKTLFYENSGCSCHYDDDAADLTAAGEGISKIEHGGSGPVVKGDGTGNAFVPSLSDYTRKCYPSQVSPCLAIRMSNSNKRILTHVSVS